MGMETRNVFVVLVNERGIGLHNGMYDHGEVYTNERQALTRRDVLKTELERVSQAAGRAFKGKVVVKTAAPLF